MYFNPDGSLKSSYSRRVKHAGARQLYKSALDTPCAGDSSFIPGRAPWRMAASVKQEKLSHLIFQIFRILIMGYKLSPNNGMYIHNTFVFVLFTEISCSTFYGRPWTSR